VVFDWYDETTHEPALKDVDKIYLVCPIAVMDPAVQVLPFLEKAVRAGVRRVVALSSVSVPEDGSMFSPMHRALRELCTGMGGPTALLLYAKFLRGSSQSNNQQQRGDSYCYRIGSYWIR